MLSITKEEFLEIYTGLEVCKYVDLFYTEPKNQKELFTTYIPSKLWRLNNIYTIVNKDGNEVVFRMNRSQHKVYAASLRHSRIIILKSRQQGISTLWLVSFFDDAITRKNFSIGLMAQGVDEASTLLERTKFLWDKLHPEVKRYFNITLDKDNTKEFSLSNKANIFIRTSFRSTTLQRLHISEMGKIANKNPDKAKETKTGTLQAIKPGNTAVIESTAEGDNMFKSMWDNAIKYAHQMSGKDFLPVFLSWIDDPDCVSEFDQPITDKQAKYFAEVEQEMRVVLTQQQKNFWIVQYRELGDKIYQEYPSTPTEAFMATKDGAYYAKMMIEHIVKHKRIVTDLFDKNLPVQLAADLGMNDTMSIPAFQRYNNETRIIDEIYDSGQDIKYYCDELKKKSWFKNVRLLILPHDAEVRELTSGKTRKEVFEEELTFDADGKPTGIYIKVLPRSDLNEGIEAVRQMIKSLWLSPVLEYLVECLYNYTKEWDEKHERWRDKPKHDEYSNGADSLRYVAQGAEDGLVLHEPTRRRMSIGMDV